MKKLFALSLYTTFLLSCNNTFVSEKKLESYVKLRSETFSLKEQRELMPNTLFKAVIDEKEPEILKQIIDENGEYLLAKNKEGDTPLGLAIQWSSLETALFIAKQMSPQYYQHQNNKGESYLYLASQKGFIELIQSLANGFYEKQKGFFNDYEFTDLDLLTDKGERALHVAKNSSVANTLLEEYNRGFLEYPLRKFKYLQNKEGQTFLHTAVRDENEDLLRWGIEKVCYKSEDTVNYIWQGLQNIATFIDMDFDNLLNTQDNQGLTALNLASKNRYLTGIHILSSCTWSDYLLKDSEGNIPLQNFLLSLDPYELNYDQKTKDIFSRLISKNTLLAFNEDFSKTIDSLNNKGESSMHLAAKLNDSFFYKELEKYGSVDLKNQEGQTPRGLFKAQQQILN
ncbi:MAG: hypothetical protein GDA46_02940 [Bdellovibrionales bacterium]|nr:hypothetical protein [Bdellovibrionales bacterium]